MSMMYIYRDPTFNLIYRIMKYLVEIIAMFFLMYDKMNEYCLHLEDHSNI